LSAGRLGYLSAVEHCSGFVIRDIGGMWDGNLRRRLRARRGVSHQPDAKTVSAAVSGVVIVAVGLELGKIGAGMLFRHAAAHSDQTAASFATAACTLTVMTGLAIWPRDCPSCSAR
jgi:hypothetical protein